MSPPCATTVITEMHLIGYGRMLSSESFISPHSATAKYYDEGFGDPYDLPNDTAYCETCGTVASVLWSYRMALLHADAAYVDVLERGLYNGVLSGISLSGDRFFYTDPLVSRGNLRRHESWNPACCQSNLVRIIPQVGRWLTQRRTMRSM